MIYNTQTIYGSIAVANIAANGPIGTAAATVNITSAITINQTTLNISATLPNPTVTTQRLMVKVVNVGTVDITVNGVVIQAGGGYKEYMWSPSNLVRTAEGGYVLASVDALASAQVIPTSTSTTLTGWTSNRDTTSSFNAATGIFRAPRTADYLFSGHVRFASATRPAGEIDVFVSQGIPINHAGTTVVPAIATAQTIGCGFSVSVRMNKGQTAAVQVLQSSGVNKTISPGSAINKSTWVSIRELPIT